jgi:putative phage-type endonuclease
MNAEQGSKEWILERCGYASASRFSDILATIKSGGEAAGRRNYRTQLVTERLTGVPIEGYHNDAMQWGIDHEEEARHAIEIELGEVIQPAPFIKHRNYPWVGCSPDGLIGKDGGLECKCPFVSTIHIDTVQRNGVPPEHVAQIQGGMWVTGRTFWLFASYDKRMPGRLKLYTKRVERDEKYIKVLQDSVLQFLCEVEETYNRLLSISKT